MDGLTISNANKFIESGGSRIGSSNSVTQPKNNSIDSSTTNVGGKSFADTLHEAIGGVNELQKISDEKIQELATGKTDDIAGVMIATEKADIALRAMVQVRNKIIDAYQEIMKMQV